MLLFQVYAEKKPPGEGFDDSKMAMRLRAVKEFLSAQLGVESASGISNSLNANISATERAFREKGIAQFMETLTPGAQNAIFAASFVWGFENAIKYVKNTMKLEEVKNAGDSHEKSRAVVDNITAQASDHSEKFRESSKVVWSFYNEDMKESQVQFAKSETLVENSSHKENSKDKEKERQMQQQVSLSLPNTAQEAVSTSILRESHNHSLLYCTAVQRELDERKDAIAEEEKKQEFARLIVVKQSAKEEEEKTILVSEERQKQPGKKEEGGEALQMALERQKELLFEYKKAEKQLQKALDSLDEMAKNEKNLAKKISAMLPEELSRFVLANAKEFSRRKALRAQLVKWLAFCQSGTASLSLPASKLLKLVSLSSLLGIRK